MNKPDLKQHIGKTVIVNMEQPFMGVVAEVCETGDMLLVGGTWVPADKCAFAKAAA